MCSIHMTKSACDMIRTPSHISRRARVDENDTTTRCWTCGLMNKKRVPLARWLGRNTALPRRWAWLFATRVFEQEEQGTGPRQRYNRLQEGKELSKVHENRYLVSVACGSQSEVWAKSSCGRSAPLGIGTEGGGWQRRDSADGPLHTSMSER
jgi:hypothetical protein